MSYSTSIRGHIDIDPPLTWAQIKDSPLLPTNAKRDGTWPDVLLNIIETTVSTDEGELTRRVADAVVPNGCETAGRTILADLQRLVDENPREEFTGRFDCEGEQAADLWRVLIRAGRAERVDAQIVWPEGSE